MLRDFIDGFRIREYHRNAQRFFLFGIPFFSGLALFYLLYNLYLLRLGFREDFIGRVAGMMPLASGLFAFPVGIWSDRIGRKPFLVAASLVLGLSQVGLCLSAHPWFLLGCAFTGGAATAFVFVNFIPFLAENSKPARRGQAISVSFSIQVLTRMLISLVGGVLPAGIALLLGQTAQAPGPFRYALLLGAGLTLSSVLPLLRIRPTESAGQALAPETGPPDDARTPWKLLAIFTSVSAFRGLSFGLSMPFLNVFFEEQLYASTAMIGMIFFFGQGVGLPSAMAAPVLSGRFGAVTTIAPLRLLAALCLAGMAWLENVPLAALCYLVIAAVESLSVPAEMSFATDLAPRRYWGRIQSLRVTGFQLCSAVGSIWAGKLILAFGYGLPFGAAGLALLGSVGVLVSQFRGRHPAEGETAR